VSTVFYTELADVLDRLMTFIDLVYVVGDLNVRLAAKLIDLLADYDLSCRVDTPTHDHGGLLDIVASRNDLPPPSVDVDESAAASLQHNNCTTLATARCRRVPCPVVVITLQPRGVVTDGRRRARSSLRHRALFNTRPTSPKTHCDVSPSIVGPMV